MNDEVNNNKYTSEESIQNNKGADKNLQHNIEVPTEREELDDADKEMIEPHTSKTNKKKKKKKKKKNNHEKNIQKKNKKDKKKIQETADSNNNSDTSIVDKQSGNIAKKPKLIEKKSNNNDSTPSSHDDINIYNQEYISQENATNSSTEVQKQKDPLIDQNARDIGNTELSNRTKKDESIANNDTIKYIEDIREDDAKDSDQDSSSILADPSPEENRKDKKKDNEIERSTNERGKYINYNHI